MEDRPLADGSVDRQSSDSRIELISAPVPSPEDRRSWYNGLFRWRYIVPRVLLAALVWAFFVFWFDPLLRYGLTTAGETVLGVKVDVGLVKTQFFPPMFHLESTGSLPAVGVTDPRRTDENAITCDEVSLRIAGEPLLHREFVIEEATVRGIRLNADRLTDGSLTEDASPESAGLDLGPLQRELTLLGLQWYDELKAAAKKQLDPSSLETVQVAESIEVEWKSRIEDLNRRIEALQRRIDAVKELTQATGPTAGSGNPVNKLDAYARATSEVQAVLEESQQMRVEVRNLPTLARRDVVRLDEARQRDTARLRERLQSLPLDPEEVTRSLIGPELFDRLAAVNAWMSWMQRYFSADAVQPSVPVSRGEWVHFPSRQANPAFVLGTLTLSGEVTRDGQPFAMTGVCRDLSSDPVLLGKPISWRFELAGPDPLAVEGLADLTTDQPLHEVAFRWAAQQNELRRPLRQTIGDERELAILVEAGSAGCDGWLRLDGTRLEGEMHLAQQPVAVRVNEAAEEFAQRWIAPALAGIHSIDATLQLHGALDDVEWRVQSNIGPQVVAGCRQLLATEIEGQRSKLLAKVDEVVRERSQQLPGVANEQMQYLLADLTSRESRAKQAVARLTNGKLDVKRVSDKLDVGRLLKR